MKYAIPWILVAVLSGGVYFFYSTSQQRAAELAKQQPATDTNAAMGQGQPGSLDLAGLRAENTRLKQENEDLPRLRSEVGRLQGEIKQLTADLQKAQAQTQQQQTQMAAENQALRAEAQQAQAQTQANLCIANLRVIQAAKVQWALQKGQTATSVPTLTDITPYLPNFALPVCPEGGVYTFNSMSSPPTCSIPGHSMTKRP